MLSSKFLYLLDAIIYITCAGGAQPVNTKILSERQRLPQRYLEPLLQELVHAKILRSIRGPKGGYVLARERRKVTVGEIYQAIYTSEASQNVSLSSFSQQIILPLFQTVEDNIRTALHHTSLEDLLNEAQQKGIPLPAGQKADFEI